MAYAAQEPGMTIDHSYAACLYRLFAFSVIDHLYPPISDKDMQEQKRLAIGHWQVGSLLSGSFAGSLQVLHAQSGYCCCAICCLLE